VEASIVYTPSTVVLITSTEEVHTHITITTGTTTTGTMARTNLLTLRTTLVIINPDATPMVK